MGLIVRNAIAADVEPLALVGYAAWSQGLKPLLPPEVNIRVELVWDPPWSPAMMEEGARAHFGWNG